MKIYFAYRNGYVANHRHLRTFEADSVLDWFVQNWPVLAAPSDSDEYRDTITDLLGEWPYGFPICDYEDDSEPVAPPQNLKQLKDKLEEFAYCNPVLVAEHCVQVLTDDDEINLAWYVFDEEYAQKYVDRISVWLQPELPLQFAAAPPPEVLMSKLIRPAGAQDGMVYWMASVIDGGGHLEDGPGDRCRIEGIRLPELLNHLRSSEAFGRRSNAPSELERLQQQCKLSPSQEMKPLFEAMGSDSSSPPDNSDGTRVIAGEHILEASLYNGFCYSYIVLFDDLWLAANLELGRSLSRFCSTWKI